MIRNDRIEVKGLALSANLNGRNPDFVFITVNEKRVEEIHRAVSFEARGKIVIDDDFSRFYSKIQDAERVVFFRNAKIIWCVLECETLLILPLLTRGLMR